MRFINFKWVGIFPIDKWDFKSESVLTVLPSEDFELLTTNKTEKVYKKGEIIFREGEYPAGIFYIIDGKVKKYTLEKDGREQMIYVANSGELLGYHAILSEGRYPDSPAALEECKVAFPQGRLSCHITTVGSAEQKVIKNTES